VYKVVILLSKKSLNELDLSNITKIEEFREVVRNIRRIYNLFPLEDAKELEFLEKRNNKK